MSQYYMAVGTAQQGPFPCEQLLTRGLRPDTIVWAEGMSQWQRADTIPELALLFVAAPVAAPVAYATAVPQFQPSQQPIVYQTVNVASSGVSGITTPLLISAIGNIVIGLAWFSTCFGIVVAIPMFILCVFEFIVYAHASRTNRENLKSWAILIGILEIVVGLFNLVSLICGIILLIHASKLEQIECLLKGRSFMTSQGDPVGPTISATVDRSPEHHIHYTLEAIKQEVAAGPNAPASNSMMHRIAFLQKNCIDYSIKSAKPAEKYAQRAMWFAFASMVISFLALLIAVFQFMLGFHVK